MRHFTLILACIALVVSLISCAATYNRLPDGSITASGGTVVLQYGPDGKTVVGEAFTPTPGMFSQGGITASQLLPLLQGASTLVK